MSKRKGEKKSSSAFESFVELYEQHVDNLCPKDEDEDPPGRYDFAEDFYETVMGDGDATQEFMRAKGHLMLFAEDTKDECFEGLPMEQREACLKAVSSLSGALATYQTAKNSIGDAIENLRNVWKQMRNTHPDWATPGRTPAAPPAPKKKKENKV
jgi:hypothetical protein